MNSDASHAEFLSDFFHGLIGGIVVNLLIPERRFDRIWLTNNRPIGA